MNYGTFAAMYYVLIFNTEFGSNSTKKFCKINMLLHTVSLIFFKTASTSEKTTSKPFCWTLRTISEVIKIHIML
jgi:hypothetical protein